MDKIIGFLSGAPSAASNAGGYYQNAINEVPSFYQAAMNNVINSTGSGSPAATTFGNEEAAALQPQFQQQQNNLAAKENAMGIGTSGAAKADFSDLASNQSATLAGQIAPLYSSALNSYQGLNAGQAGAQAGIAGQMPGAQNTAYQQAINNFYAGVTDAASAAGGVPPTATPAQAPGYGTSVVQPNAQYGPQYDANGQVIPPSDIPIAPADYNPYATTP